MVVKKLLKTTVLIKLLFKMRCSPGNYRSSQTLDSIGSTLYLVFCI